MGFFEKLGVDLKVERGRRVFPSSDCAKDVRDAMSDMPENLESYFRRTVLYRT